MLSFSKQGILKAALRYKPRLTCRAMSEVFNIVLQDQKADGMKKARSNTKTLLKVIRYQQLKKSRSSELSILRGTQGHISALNVAPRNSKFHPCPGSRVEQEVPFRSSSETDSDESDKKDDVK